MASDTDVLAKVEAIDMKAPRDPDLESQIMMIEVAQTPWGKRNGEYCLIAYAWHRYSWVGATDKQGLLDLARALLIAADENDIAAQIESYLPPHHLKENRSGRWSPKSGSPQKGSPKSP